MRGKLHLHELDEPSLCAADCLCLAVAAENLKGETRPFPRSFG